MENKDLETIAWYSSIETLGAVDGPGLRLVVFLQGCPIRCLFCHNPETWEWKQENKITVQEVIDKYYRNESFYKANNGGITISGGEGLGQLDFALALAKECKKRDIHLTFDTALGTYMGDKVNKIIEIAKLASLFLIDVKHPDPDVCEKLTLSSTVYQNEMDFIKTCEKLGIPYWIRHVYVPTYSDTDDHYMIRLGRMIGTLKNMVKFEILPYHDMMKPKYEGLGIKFPLMDLEPPTAEMVAKVKKLIIQGAEESRKDPSLNPIFNE